MSSDPAGDPFAQPHLELLGCLVDVFADLALHGDRDQVLAVQPVDPGIVEVEQLAELGRDGEADLLDAREPAEARAKLLDRLELGCPRRHLAVVLRGPDGHGGLGREGAHRVELVRRPVVRPIVIHVEQPEQFGAVEHRGRADRVEPFLDHGGAHRAPTGIVGVAHREERPARDDGSGGQGRGGEVTDGGEILGREAVRDLGHDPPVRFAQEDGDAIRLEQDRGVVHEAGQRLIEVQPAPDVPGHPAQGIEAVELLSGVFQEARRVHPVGELACDRVEEFEIPLREAVRRL